jgi:hypothetical protein
MENETKKLPELKVPLIGDVNVAPFEEIYEERSIEMLPVDEDLFLLEKEIGNHLFVSGEYIKILNLLFPEVAEFTKKNVYSIIYERKTGTAPLIFKNFGIDSPGDDSDEAKAKRSVWANLMLDLGEFNLDKDNGGYEKNLPYIYMSNSTTGEQTGYCAIYARFESSGELLKEIWERILGDDTVAVFIEDDPEFGELFNLESDTQKIELGKKYWINAGEEYDGIAIKKKITKLIGSFRKIGEEKKAKKEKKKLVFIVDLLYKKDGINRIKGTDLLRHIRETSVEASFVIAFTGGKSPFIINSAAKVGADAVIMKARSNGLFADGHYLPGSETIASNKIDSSGLFDLLWVLSKNLSRLRFLETVRQIVDDNKKCKEFDYKNVLDKLFFSIEDESPFWRNYLRVWAKDIDDILFESVLSMVE